MPGAVRSRTWSCGTAAEPAAKTGSASPRTTGLANLPLHGFDQNRIWLAIVQLALDLTAWMQMLGLADHDARRWEPKRLRLRLFSIAGKIATHARRTHLKLSSDAPWTDLIINALQRLAARPMPA